MIENKINCDQLTVDQLEAIGEYLMEKMHPGESHKSMHQMMGMEEGTEYHKNFHINMVKTMYCGQNSMMGFGGMIGMMPMMNTMGNMMTNNGWGMTGWFGWIFMILFWALIIVAIIALIKWLLGAGKMGQKKGNPLEILKERYAKGEIDKKEFEEKKKDLN